MQSSSKNQDGGSGTTTTIPTSSGGQQHISWNQIKIVQNLIERCLQKYMTQTEIITALHTQANIEPGFTCLVWQKLEEQNPDFFYAYNIRLRIKDQIVAFNYLVDQQCQFVQRLRQQQNRHHSLSPNPDNHELSLASPICSTSFSFSPNQVSLDHGLDLDGLKPDDSPLMSTHNGHGLNPDGVDLNKTGALGDLENPGSGDMMKPPPHLGGQSQNSNQLALPEMEGGEEPRPAMLETDEDMAQATNELFAEPLISPVKDMETNVFFS